MGAKELIERCGSLCHDIREYIVGMLCALIHKCPKCGKHLACDDNDFSYGNWYCPNCDGNCEEEIGIKEPISKTFPRVNEFEIGASYMR